MHLSEEDGMGVLENIKSSNPAQIIVAYSMHSYDLSKQKFFNLADDAIGKPTSSTVIKEKIDNLILTKFSIKYPTEVLRDLLINNNSKSSEIKNLENKIARFHRLGTDPNWGEMLRFVPNPATKEKVKKICHRILKNLKY